MAIMGLLATVGVGFLGDQSRWGPAAAYALVGLRVLQGFAIGGEYGGAAIYVAEHSPPNRRGASTGWIQASASLGVFLALAVVFVVRKLMGEEVFSAWGWRIPFWLSAVLLRVSLWIRLRLNESAALPAHAGRRSPVPKRRSQDLFSTGRALKIVLKSRSWVFSWARACVWYTAQFYTQFFLERVLKVDPLIVYALMMTISVVGAALHVVFGLGSRTTSDASP